MFGPPKLTKEQKEHHRQAHRSNAQVGNTWQIFTMYLQMGKSPEVALLEAERAMEIWIPWEDSKVIEYPDIDPPDFNEGLQVVMRTAMDEAERRKIRRDVVAEAMQEINEISTEASTEGEVDYGGMYEGLDSTEVNADCSTERPSEDSMGLNPRAAVRPLDPER